MISHFVNVFKKKLEAINCKHEVSYEASCPYTGKTYTGCQKCLKRLGVRETNEQ
jgi:hypothetical protein